MKRENFRQQKQFFEKNFLDQKNFEFLLKQKLIFLSISVNVIEGNFLII